jgi:hypothetical protein
MNFGSWTITRTPPLGSSTSNSSLLIDLLAYASISLETFPNPLLLDTASAEAPCSVLLNLGLHFSNYLIYFKELFFFEAFNVKGLREITLLGFFNNKDIAILNLQNKQNTIVNLNECI